jgi:hypothetical protein
MLMSFENYIFIRFLCTSFSNCQRTNIDETLRLPNPHIFGGGERDRTDGLLRARQALSQLSYTPSCSPLDKNGGPGWI